MQFILMQKATSSGIECPASCKWEAFARAKKCIKKTDNVKINLNAVYSTLIPVGMRLLGRKSLPEHFEGA